MDVLWGAAASNREANGAKRTKRESRYECLLSETITAKEEREVMRRERGGEEKEKIKIERIYEKSDKIAGE